MQVSVVMNNGLIHKTFASSFAKALNNVRYRHYPRFSSYEFMMIVSVVRANTSKIRLSGFVKDDELYIVGKSRIRMLKFKDNLFVTLRALSSLLRS